MSLETMGVALLAAIAFFFLGCVIVARALDPKATSDAAIGFSFLSLFPLAVAFGFVCWILTVGVVT